MDVLGFALRFVLAVLATWRVTHLLAAEDGPADVIIRFRKLLGRSFFGLLMDCFYCLSIWIAAPAALFVTRYWLDWIMVWLAISGAACLLERTGQQHHSTGPMSHQSQGEPDHVLWTETNGSQEQLIELEPDLTSVAPSATAQPGIAPGPAADRFDTASAWPENGNPDDSSGYTAGSAARSSSGRR